MSKAFDFARSIEGSGSFEGLIIPASSSTTQVLLVKLETITV